MGIAFYILGIFVAAGILLTLIWVNSYMENRKLVIGVMGLGTVGGALKKWLDEQTDHEVRAYDPPKGIQDSLIGCDAIFICVPVPADGNGQDTGLLSAVVNIAKGYSQNVFVRSTVLPGTCDRLGVTAMPEFLTARRAYMDMLTLPLLVGPCNRPLFRLIFKNRSIFYVENVEAELAKYAHNCFGAVKVTYFNMIFELCKKYGANFDSVRRGAFLTGFIEREHTLVPGPDGKRGYGGACFPENMSSLIGFTRKLGMNEESLALSAIARLNDGYRDEGAQ